MLWVTHPAHEICVVPLVRALCPVDRDELASLSGGRSVTILCGALAESFYSFSCFDEEGPIAVGGMVKTGQWPRAWMLGAAERVRRQKRLFLRMSRDETAEMMRVGGGRIDVAIDPRWTKSVRWLAWLGFAPIGEEVEFAGRRGIVMEAAVA